MASNNVFVAQNNGGNALQTPSRDKERDRHPFPHSVHPSPGHPSAHRTFTSSSAPSSNILTASSSSISSSNAMTAQHLLKQHENASDPKMAALEQAVNERNVLSSQNTQLWKLIEKQRSGYNQMHKELERIRSERDSYKSKLLALGAANDKRQKASDRSTRPSAEATSNSTTTTDSGSSKPLQITRHNSDDNNTTPRVPKPSASLHYSRSHEPLSQDIDTSFQSYHHETHGATLQPPPSSAPSTTTATGSTPSKPARQHPAPLVVPQRSVSTAIASDSPANDSQDSLLAYSHDNTSINSRSSTTSEKFPINAYQYPPRKSSLADSINSSLSVTSPNLTVNVATATTPGSTVPSSQAAGNHSSTPQQSHFAVTTPQTAPPMATLQVTMSPTTPRVSTQHLQASFSGGITSGSDPRSSRITLPEEARHYIANMVDSPVQSPKVDSFTASAKPKVSSNLVPKSFEDTYSNKKGEFLDLTEDDDDDDDDEEVEDDEEGEVDEQEDSESMLDKVQMIHPNAAPSSISTSSETIAFSVPGYSLPNPHDDLDLVQQGRIPPMSVNASESLSNSATITAGARQEQQHSTHDNTSPPGHDKGIHQPHPHLEITTTTTTSKAASASASSLPTLSDMNSSTTTPPPAYSPESGSSTNPFSQSARMDHGANSPSRPAPDQFHPPVILPFELSTAMVTVSHSSVRPNDRGKEVLSFVITVNPGNGKGSWRIEKLYSDILNLDHKVRSSVGKSLGKKITSLPEGRLWKDHAPAKVDQRKAVLENYLQSLVRLPVKNNDEVVAFLTSDVVRETRQPVVQAGYKEGYLTKRGKNFGGWKTRYFVLQGPVLEYYESRGGAHLGSILVTGAQIGRQQRTDRQTGDDEKEYRHAFLIVEAKKGPGGNHPRHVLCAESDQERDAWVEMLVRYFTGTYSEEPLNYGSSSSSSAVQHTSAASRTSTSSTDSPSSRKPPIRGLSKDDISISKGAAVPLSQLPQDHSNAKLFQNAVNVEEYNNRSSSPVKDSSPIERAAGGNSRGPTNESQSQSQTQNQNLNARRILERLQGLPSSLPDTSSSSSLSSAQPFQDRPNSELGHYADTSGRKQTQSPERHRARDPHESRKSFHPTLGTVASSPVAAAPPDRVPSPDKLDATKIKISPPMNGTPIPQGFKFGKDPSEASSGSNDRNDRREKARSRFWNGWKNTGDKQPVVVPRVVFGVPLEESLEVAQICNLPAIVFRAIQYLEAKKADQEEGIYRLSGSSAVIKSLKDRFNAEGDVNLLASDEYWDPHAIAGLLKSYLRELPSSILTRDLHLRFLSVIDFVDAQERIKELSQLIAALPLANYSLLRALTAHLIRIVQNSSTNKMTMRNVGIVFSPTLGIPAGVFSLMLGEFNRVFNVDAVKESSKEEDDADPLRRNSKQYSDAAADQILGLTGRSLTAPGDDTQSEVDDYSSVHDESGTETADGATVETISSSQTGNEDTQTQHIIRVSPPDTPKATKAASAASSKGLNISVSPNRSNRYSRVITGLPTSPRPPRSPARNQEMPAASTE